MCDDIDKKIKVPRKEHVPVPLWPPQIPHGLVKGKVKYTLVQALRLCTGRMAHRKSRAIALPFHDHGTRRGEGSVPCPGCSLPPEKTR